jgi:hypothetical protein
MAAWKKRWPLGRGFERFYGFLGGESSCWYPDLVHDNHPVEPPATSGVSAADSSGPSTRPAQASGGTDDDEHDRRGQVGPGEALGEQAPTEQRGREDDDHGDVQRSSFRSGSHVRSGAGRPPRSGSSPGPGTAPS